MSLEVKKKSRNRWHVLEVFCAIALTFLTKQNDCMFWDISVHFPSCFATDKATTYFKTFLFIFPHVFDKTKRQHILERFYAFSHIFLTLRTNGRRLVEPFCRFSHTFLKGENDGMFWDFSVYFPHVFEIISRQHGLVGNTRVTVSHIYTLLSN